MSTGELFHLDDRAQRGATRRLTGALEARRGPHHRVALLCGNTPGFVATRDAATALGISLVPINPKLAPPEIAYILRHAAADVLLVEQSLRHVAREAASSIPTNSRPEILLIDDDGELIEPSDAPLGPAHRVGVIGATTIYTSGTTGLPKGCVRGASQEKARAAELISTYSIDETDVHIVACPLAHSAPGIFLRACRSVGADTWVMRRFDAEGFLAAVQRSRASLFFLVPTQYERILALPRDVRARYDVSSVRVAIVAGAPITRDTKQRIIEWLGKGVLWEFYGSSETGTVSVLPPADQLTRAGSVGRPPHGVDLRLVDERGAPVPFGEVGEIYVRSPTVMSGYLDPTTGRVTSRESADGFITVGDLGRLDEDGYLSLVDRKHDTIISGGVNVYPAEVERALTAHPRIEGAVAFGVADDDWGQIVAAAIVVTAPHQLTGAEVRAFLRGRVAAYKIPKALAFIRREELPVGASGKPQRRTAAAQLTGRPALRRYD